MELGIPSDQHTLWTHVAGGRGASFGHLGRYKIDTLDEKLFGQILTDMAKPADQTVAEAWAAPRGQGRRRELLERLAEEITKALQTALQATAKRSSGKAQGYTWWNQECREARHDWHHARKQLQTATQAGLPGHREF